MSAPTRALIAVALLAVAAVRAGAQPSREEPPTVGPAPVATPGSPVPASNLVPPGSMHPEDPPTPCVRLQVRVQASVEPGKELEYRLSVKNNSPAAAHHVRLRNPLNASVQFVRATPLPTSREPELVWELGTLKANESRDIVLVVLPTGDGDVKNCARVQFEHGQCVTTTLARPKLNIVKQGPVRATLNDAVSYRIEVRNVGAAEATGVVLSDQLPEGLEAVGGPKAMQWDIGTLKPGQVRAVDYQALAKKKGVLNNVAVVTAAGKIREEAHSSLTVGEAQLLLKVEGPGRAAPGKPISLRLTVSNAGDAATGNVALSCPLPAKTTFLSASDGGRMTANAVQWAVGSLPPGSARVMQLALQSAEAGEVVVKAASTAEHGQAVEGEARVLVEGAVGLTVDVDLKDPTLKVGAATLYTVTVHNQGTAPATDVRVVATVPPQMKVDDAQGASAAHRTGQEVAFEPLPSLALGSPARYQIAVTGDKSGEARFLVQVSAKELEAGPVTKQRASTVYDTSPEAASTPNLNPEKGP